MKKQNGFSLIEILVVLVIMGLLISVVAPTVLNSADDARVQKVQADFKAIETALKIYRLITTSIPAPSRSRCTGRAIDPRARAPKFQARGLSPRSAYGSLGPRVPLFVAW